MISHSLANKFFTSCVASVQKSITDCTPSLPNGIGVCKSAVSSTARLILLTALEITATIKQPGQ